MSRLFVPTVSKRGGHGQQAAGAAAGRDATAPAATRTRYLRACALQIQTFKFPATFSIGSKLLPTPHLHI